MDLHYETEPNNLDKDSRRNLSVFENYLFSTSYKI